MSYAWSPAPPAGDTWLVEGLATAARMLREVSDQVAVLTGVLGAVASAVAWESPAAEAFEIRASAARSDSVAIGVELHDLHADALRLHGCAVLAQAG